MGGTLWSMLAGYAARMVPAGRRGRAIAIVLAGITLALSAGLPAGTALAARLGWRPAFALLATLALIVAAWIRWKAPGFPGERAGQRPPLRRVAVRPGVPAVLAVTLLLLTGHQELYTYLAPFAARSGPGHTGLVLLVFGLATIPGLAVTGLLADRHLRSVLVAALTLVVAALLALGLTGRDLGPMLAAAALWGAAFGGVPALLQTALISASGPGYADMATSLQTTVYNIGIAAGSLVGGLVLQGAGVPALPWAASVLIAAALAIVSCRRVGLRRGSPELTGSG